MSNVNFSLSSAIPVLERTPRVLRAALADLPAEWVRANEGPDTWSPFDILGHLIQGERADWIPRARIIIEQGANRRFTPFDRAAQFRDSKDKSVTELLDEFEQLRNDSLATLRGWSISEGQLDLTGEHPAFGTVTLRQLLSTWTAHDLSHLAQIARVMAKRYRDDIGPWRQYLPIMDR